MKTNALETEYVARHPFLVCIDSDGCAFDTMEIKHKECFCPATIDNWDLQPISSLAREAWEFVNLYSKTRGCSRFHAVIRVLDLLKERPEVQQREFTMPPYEHFRQWVQTAPILNNDAVSKLTDDPEMARVLRWSLDMNARVAKMVHGIPPFPFVRESLQKLSEYADIVIVSATPREALVKEWHEHGIDRYVALLGAQEDGTKAEIIAAVKGQYAPDHAVMLGDAPGDQTAAAKNGILFYPIRPLDETASWEEFYRTTIDRFLTGTYAGDCMQAYVDRFEQCLPELPPWKTK
ncbi:MAG: HAD family hydrolase [Clostridia bacterium]|nr:HAD family hydrolase [Clostridia bacterium]